MGYQRVVKPKFYIDTLSYLHATGKERYFDKIDLLYGNPVSIVKYDQSDILTSIGMSITNDSADFIPPLPINFVATLNHNFVDLNIYTQIYTGINESVIIGQGDGGSLSSSVNSSETQSIGFCGFTLEVLNTPIVDEILDITLGTSNSAAEFGKRYLGSWMIGSTWSPPHNPNLTYTHDRKYDGIKLKETKGGHTLGTINYLTSDWAGHNQFELWKYPTNHGTPTEENMFIEDPNLKLGRTSKRSWKLQWDDISDSEMFAELEQSNDINDLSSSNFDNPFIESDSFISRVWTPTLGGKLAFLFQFDDSNNNPDNFAICRLKQRSLKITPKAPNLYNFSITIEEVC